MAVLLQTTEGELTVDLFAEDAPYSAYNFLKLCKAKYYNNVAFHRVEKNFLASAGAPLTADARWNVAGLGGVAANFLKLGNAENLVETGKTNAEYVERCGGCSFWGVQTLAAEKCVTLRLASRPFPGGGHLPFSVKTEDSGAKVATDKHFKKEADPVPCAELLNSSTCSLTPGKTHVLSSPLTNTGDSSLPATHSTSFSPTFSTSSSSSSSICSSSSASSFSSFSSSASQACTTSSSSSSSSSSSFCVSPRKSLTRKSGWDRDDSASPPQQTSYFSSLNFSHVAFPPFPSSPIPNAPSSLRPPLRVPSSARFCPAEPSGANDLRRRHIKKGMIGWIPSVVSAATGSMLQQHLGGLTAEQQRRLHGEASSLFYMTLREDIDFLDKRNLTLFGCVTEGLEVLEKINQTFVDDRFVPLTPVRILHTYVLDDPFEDPPLLHPAPESPLPLVEEVLSDEEDMQDEVLLLEKVEKKEAEARKVTLEILGDLPSADAKPPENVLFVAQLNPVTEDDDLRTVFARFGEILSCDVIRDWKTKQSLQYAFITFAERSACELAYFKMQNVLIDDRRIHVDFSQSVARTWQQYKQSGRFMQQQSQQQLQEKSSRPATAAKYGGHSSGIQTTGRHNASAGATARAATAAAAAAAGGAANGKGGRQQGWDAHSAADSQAQQQVHREKEQASEAFNGGRRSVGDSGRRGADICEGGRFYNSHPSGIEKSRRSREVERRRHVYASRARDRSNTPSSWRESRYYAGRGSGSEAAAMTTARGRREEEPGKSFSWGRERQRADAATRDGDSAAKRGRRAAERKRRSSSDESSSRSRSKEVMKRRRGRGSSPRGERRLWKKKERGWSSISSSSDSEFSDEPRKKERKTRRTAKHAKKKEIKGFSKKHTH